ncbi:MAG: SRPBCC family protein [Thermoproteus sp.]
MIGSIKFRVERRVDDAEGVWRRLSKLEDMPKYWGGHRRVEVLGVSSGIYSLRITFAFPGPLNTGYAEAAVDEARREVLLNYIRGPFTGVVRNSVAGGVLASDWDIVLSPLFIPLKPWVSSHFRKGAEHALERLSRP